MVIIYTGNLHCRRVSFLCVQLKLGRVLISNTIDKKSQALIPKILAENNSSNNLHNSLTVKTHSQSQCFRYYQTNSNNYLNFSVEIYNSTLNTHKNFDRSFITQVFPKVDQVEDEEEAEEEKMSSSIPNVVFVLGGPGAGKGTQCSKIVKEFGFVHLSAGDLLREERNKPGSEYGELIEQHIRDGTIVPVEITCSLIDRAMQKNAANNFLIDGFPRNQNNLDGWEKQMAGKANILFVLFFDAPEDLCVARCLQRGEAGSGRSDDNPESMKKRVLTYVNETMPIIQHFQTQNLVRTIDASKDADTVFEQVRVNFDQLAAN